MPNPIVAQHVSFLGKPANRTITTLTVDPNAVNGEKLFWQLSFDNDGYLVAQQYAQRTVKGQTTAVLDEMYEFNFNRYQIDAIYYDTEGNLIIDRKLPAISHAEGFDEYWRISHDEDDLPQQYFTWFGNPVA